MEKVKIFEGQYTEKVEEKINKWLVDNNITINRALQSTSTIKESYEDRHKTMLTISIFYNIIDKPATKQLLTEAAVEEIPDNNGAVD